MPEPDADIVAAVSNLLRDAQEGKFAALAVAVQYGDGSAGTLICRGRGSNIWMLIGATARLMHRLQGQVEDLLSADDGPPGA